MQKKIRFVITRGRGREGELEAGGQKVQTSGYKIHTLEI